MGFMSYTLGGSDNTADMTSRVFNIQLKKLKSELRRRDNEYNTPGFMNVAMYIREIMMKQTTHLKSWNREGHVQLADLCLERLNLELIRLSKIKYDATFGAEEKCLKETKAEIRKMIKSVERFKGQLK